MLDNLLYRVAELERIVGAMIRMGTIEEVDHDKALCRVRSGGILTGWLQWATTRAMGEKAWWAPRIGEQVMIFSPWGDLAQGKVMMAFYQDKATAPANSPDIHRIEYPNGTVITHDTKEGRMTMDIKGDLSITATGHISIKGATVRINE